MRARGLEWRANTRGALNSIHCFSLITSECTRPCLSHKCLPRTLRATGGGGGGGEEGCLTGESAALDKGTELER